jgi:hypothetical protein
LVSGIGTFLVVQVVNATVVAEHWRPHDSGRGATLPASR